jgi:hypothetical protein
MTLVLRRAQGHRHGDWGPHDFDVLDSYGNVGRIWQKGISIGGRLR